MPLPPLPATRSAWWLGLVLAAPLAAQAAGPAAPPPAAAPTTLSAQDISLLAGTCVNCHGPDSRSSGGIPALRGASAAHLLQRLQAFKAGTAPHTTVMTRLMKGYDDQQIQALAQWFSKEAP